MANYRYSKMSDKDLETALKKELRNAYDKMERIKKAGYEDFEANKAFRDELQSLFGIRNVRTMQKKVGELNHDELVDTLQFVVRHSKNTTSSLTSIREFEKKNLTTLMKLSGEYNEDLAIESIKRDRKTGEYTLKGSWGDVSITPTDLKEFWEIVNNVRGRFEFDFLKGGSDYAISYIYEKFFKDKNANPKNIIAKLKRDYKKEQEQERREREKKQKEIYSRVTFFND